MSSVEIVYQVCNDLTGEDLASFPAGTDAAAHPARGAAVDMCRGLNVGGWTHTVVRSHLIRDHRLPCFRDRVI